MSLIFANSILTSAATSVAITLSGIALSRRYAVADRTGADAASVRVAGMQSQNEFMRALQAECKELREWAQELQQRAEALAKRADTLERDLGREKARCDALTAANRELSGRLERSVTH